MHTAYKPSFFASTAELPRSRSLSSSMHVSDVSRGEAAEPVLPVHCSVVQSIPHFVMVIVDGLTSVSLQEEFWTLLLQLVKSLLSRLSLHDRCFRVAFLRCSQYGLPLGTRESFAPLSPFRKDIHHSTKSLHLRGRWMYWNAGTCDAVNSCNNVLGYAPILLCGVHDGVSVWHRRVQLQRRLGTSADDEYAVTGAANAPFTIP